MNRFSSIEICAGAGGQALGLEIAGFHHVALIEIEPEACKTLKLNRPNWNVIEQDVKNFSSILYPDIDLLAGGVPCPPFSSAGKKLGREDDRDLFPEALRLIEECHPKAVMLENVRGLLDSKFNEYRSHINTRLENLGYIVNWKLLNASDYGVSQLRPRVICVALKRCYSQYFSWPEPQSQHPLSVGDLLYDLMKENGWREVNDWRKKANKIAPTLVGGSKKHGGPDLGPTRSKSAWAELSVDGHGLWDSPPSPDFVGMPRITPRMAARIQGFPDTWEFSGKKTAMYRQIGNALPPPVAKAVGERILAALSMKNKGK